MFVEALMDLVEHLPMHNNGYCFTNTNKALNTFYINYIFSDLTFSVFFLATYCLSYFAKNEYILIYNICLKKLSDDIQEIA
jgi:hypothetical protein